MKKLIYSSFILALFGTGFIGCKKEGITTQNQASNENQQKSKLISEIEVEGETILFEYNLDNKKQLDPSYNLESDQFINVVEGIIDKRKQKKIIIHSFSDRNIYLEFASQYPHLEKADKFERLIQDYIQNNPQIIQDCEDNDSCSEYLKYQEEVYDKIFGEDIRSKAPTTINSSYLCQGSSWVMFSPVVPVMAPGWNNRTSSIFGLNIISNIHLYKRRFFRNRMASFIGFKGWSCISFFGGLSFINNQTSSVLH